MKRKLSLVLALVMLISLLPNAFATPAAEPFEHEYVLSQAAFNTDMMVGTDGNDYETNPVIRNADGTLRCLAMMNWEYVIPEEFSKDGTAFMAMNLDVTDKWAFVGKRAIEHDPHIKPNEGFWYEAIKERMLMEGQPQYLVLRLNVETAGEYFLQLRGTGEAVYPEVFFFRDGLATNNVAEETYPANSSLGHQNPNGAEYTTIGTVNATEAGDYILAFQFDSTSAEKNTNATQFINLKGIKLVEKVEDELYSISIKLSSASIFAGNTAKITGSSVWTVSGNRDLSPSEVTFESSDDAIATVDENGVVTGVSEGEAEITATHKENPQVQTSVTITVKASATQRTFEYITSQAAFNTDKMIVTNAAFDETPVIREANSYMYYMPMLDWKYEVSEDYSSDGTAFEAMNLSATDKWAHVATLAHNSSPFVTSGYFNFEAPLANINDTSRSPYAIFRLEVDAPGEYILQLRGVSTDPVYPAVYFFAEGEEGVTVTDRATYPANSKLGYFDCNTTSYVGIGKVNVENAGNYILAFNFDSTSKAKNSITAYQQLRLSGIKLIPSTEDEIIGFSVTSSKSSIMTGNTTTVIANRVWAILGEEELSPSKVDFESSSDEIATVDENGVVTGVSEGTATITATLKEDDTKFATVDISVTAPKDEHIHEYILTYAALNTEKMIVSPAKNFDEIPVIREANNAIYFMRMLDWEYKVPEEYSKDETPFMAMNLNATDPWAHVSTRVYNSSPFITGTYFSYEAVLSRIDDTASSPNAVFRLHIDAPGKYILQVRGVSGTSVYPAVYFFAEGEEGVTVTDQTTYPANSKLGYFDSNAPEYAGMGEVEVKEAGNYIIAFPFDSTSRAKNSVTDYQWLRLTGIRLVPAAMDSLKALSVKAETDISYYGETINLDISEVWEYAGKKAVDYSKLTIESLNPDIATVDASGLVTPHKEGRAKIIVKHNEAPEIKGEFKVDVYDPDAENLGTRLEYVIGTITMKDQTSYNPHNNRLDEQGRLRELSYVSSYDAIDEEKTELWAYNNASPVRWSLLEVGAMNFIVQEEDFARGAFYALKLRVPVKGTYNVNVEVEPFTAGAYADVYMFPKGDKSLVVFSDLEEREPIGRVHCNNFDETVQNVGSFTVDRGGDYYFVLKFGQNNPNLNLEQGYNFQIKKVELKAAPGPFEEIKMNIETLDGAGDALYFNAYRKLNIALCGAKGMEIEGVDPEYITINDISISSDKEGVAYLRKEGNQYYVETGTVAGEAEINLDLTYRGENVTATFPFVVADVGKTGRTIYSDEMIKNAHDNIKEYDWARAEKDKTVRRADQYLELGLDALWDAVPSQDIPRSVYVGFYGDTDVYKCRYCGKDLEKDYGIYPYVVNMIRDPWKVKCPACSRSFPSNDFESFYELGRTAENGGKFDRITALERHRNEVVWNLLSEEARAMTSPGEEFSADWYTYYGYGVKGGYLHNDLYPEVGTDSSKVKFTTEDGLLNGDASAYKTLVPETTERWGVDDGVGYNTGRVYANGTKEYHTYIGFYVHNGIFDVKSNCYIQEALNKIGEAYLYTGKEKYGIAGAIILDRIADNYPDYDFREMFPYYWSSHGGSAAGKATGRIRESYVAECIAKAYDVFWPAFEYPEVIEFLNAKAVEYGLENDKSSATKIRQNIEDGVCREIFKALQTAQIQANFGIHHWTAATALASLDHKKDSGEILEWLYAASRSDDHSMNTGGDIEKTLVNTVYRDGQNYESPIYNQYTVSDLMQAAIVLNRYRESGGEMDRDSLLEHPKYLAVINSYRKLTLVRRGTKTMADSGTADLYSHVLSKDDLIKLFYNTKSNNDPFVKRENIKIAQQLYMQVGEKLKEIHGDIWTKNPESVYEEVSEIIKQYGDGDYDKSTIMTGYGFGALRDGTLFDTTGITGIRDTTRDFTLNFSGHMGHQHHDFLDLGMEAYGIGMTTDLGYPEAAADGDPHTAQWAGTSLAHNTVTVNEEQPQRPNNTPQEPLHFDAKDTRVKVIDARTPDAYPNDCEEFRRTIVMIDYDDEVSYGVDFFRVVGGKDHAYTFGPLTNERPEHSDNLSFIKQVDDPQGWVVDDNHYPTSSYAGPTVQFGWDPGTDRNNLSAPLHYPKGYTWMFNVERCDNPGEKEFWLDWQIEDFRNGARNSNLDVRLRLTMVNDFDADEITLASSKPQRTGENKELGDLERVLIRRKGTNLDSLFTAVYEPYLDGNRYVKEISSEGITVEKIDDVGEKLDYAKAVKVVLKDGRIDYVVYASNKNNTYRITDTETGYSFEFAGFVGVWTITESGESIYSYLHDGSMLGEGEYKVAGAEAAVTGTVIDFQDKLSLDNWIDVEFDRDLTEEETEDLVDRMINIERDSAGNSSYVIEGVTMTDARNARIDLDSVTPISKYVDDMDFSKGFIYDIEVGKTFEIPMSYEDNGAPVFDAVEDKRVSVGSSITVTVNAVPVSEDLTVSYSARTLPRGAMFDAQSGTFSWKPSTTQLGKNLVAIDAVDSMGRVSTVYFEVEVLGSVSGGGGGGGGDTPSTDKPTDEPDEPTVEPDEPKDEPTTDEPVVDVPTEKGFRDLGNHAWATDAINYLADEGIIKGTSETTFSPASNITRADYAILLVRAFELESEDAENFADVDESDYFAEELAVARNTGIVGGIGDNKYAPRNTITRQDMMVILYRALTK
ncbi:MAG: Ig-like domain-containing protein, partial [Oscillospiraceae bacterium]|nr:Ig-like domain-containing protein [Oscillospiraceae bacterium]